MLHRFTRDDIAELISWIPDERFAIQWAGPKYSFNCLEENLSKALQESKLPIPAIYLFTYRIQSHLPMIGHIQLLRVDREHRTGRIGKVIIRPGEWNQHHGRDMVTAVCSFAFQEIGLNRLTLSVHDFNINAKRVYENIGFRVVEFIPESVRIG